MRLNLDFASTTPRISGRSLVLLSAALVALSAAAWNAFSMFEETQHLSRRLLVAAPSRAPARETLPSAQAGAINRAIRQLNLPWDRLFAEVEARLDNRVALLALEPDAANRVLRLNGEAKSADDMLDFVRGLNQSAFLGEAVLVRHEVNQADRNRPLRFTVEARWAAD